MRMTKRRMRHFQTLKDQRDFDVVILGAGVHGSCVYDTLCRSGYRVLLADKGDFSSGTSQSSGMMVWGGLLYLRNFDLPSVVSLSRDRDRMLREKKSWVSRSRIRYLASVRSDRPKCFVRLALWFYWLIGFGRMSSPSSQDFFPENGMIEPGKVSGSLVYEEGFLKDSDARLVYRWLGPHRGPGQIAFNHCKVEGTFERVRRRWSLEVRDLLSGETHSIEAGMIVNCAGVWTDAVNSQFGIQAPFRHVWSKGVYLGVRRDPRHTTTLIFELGKHRDVVTFVPWGPIALWGPTETEVHDLESGFSASSSDVETLLQEYNQRFQKKMNPGEIISIRCGIRPLCVPVAFDKSRYPLDLSRRMEICESSDRRWISCYGGKLTDSSSMASKVASKVRKVLTPSAEKFEPNYDWEDGMEWVHFPGLAEPVPSPSWSAEEEYCYGLEDYLRRRTNIAQWVERGGFGLCDENSDELKKIALILSGNDEAKADRMFCEYRDKIIKEFDALLWSPGRER